MPKLYDIDRPRNFHVGSIILCGSGNPFPFHALFCDGSVYNIADYPALGAKLHSIYGGDGVTTFAVPDYRSRTPIGVGQGSGLTINYALGTVVGEETHILSEAEMPTHSHTGTSAFNAGHNHSYVGAVGAGGGGSGSANAFPTQTTNQTTSGVGDHAHTVFIGSTGSGVGHDNMAPSQPCFVAIIY